MDRGGYESTRISAVETRQESVLVEQISGTTAVPPSSPAVAPGSLGLFAIAISAIWVAIAAFAFHTNQPDNALTTDWQDDAKSTVQTLLPEQWGFFTRSPREDVLVPYRFAEDGGWSSAALYPHSQAQHAFGWNRVSRAQAVEVGLVYTSIPEAKWIECDMGEELADCLDSADTATSSWHSSENASPAPTLCGLGAITRSRTAPWAYANIGQQQTSYSIALVNVSC